MIDNLKVNSLNEQPSIEVDFNIEEYSLGSRMSLGQLYSGLSKDISSNIVVGKNLDTGELISVPYELRRCRISRRIIISKKIDYDRTLQVLSKLKEEL